ncbi:helix-turn-helix transcriptional regulator [Georgenia subflava]|uniref:WYL domain-containing protein n=1 Tax=Georgenia subflava TaxID=1622177 RepID=A0A6N7ELM0_9MICO|nr:YafY family protein [Georgenia subflava]MPV37445.1 WYL domain-containing protein [Georgenia subflava]
MLETSVRLLRLLALLQTGRTWTGAELAERLAVTTRTVRNDLGRLRLLGYEVTSRTGPAGGYKLDAGTAVPPLLLDDDEAVAIAVALRAAASGSVTGIEETATRALVKLERTLPARLRPTLEVVRSATDTAPSEGPTVAPDVLSAVATAIHRHERLRFDYTSHGGTESRRDVEPHRLVYTGRRWYLLAWDVGRTDWRTFRADRLQPKVPTGPRFTPRDAGDAVARVLHGTSTAVWPFRARARLHASTEVMARRLDWNDGAVTAEGPTTCVIETGGPSLMHLAGFLVDLDVDFEILEPPELRPVVRRLADRLRAAVADGNAVRGG